MHKIAACTPRGFLSVPPSQHACVAAAGGCCWPTHVGMHHSKQPAAPAPTRHTAAVEADGRLRRRRRDQRRQHQRARHAAPPRRRHCREQRKGRKGKEGRKTESEQGAARTMVCVPSTLVSFVVFPATGFFSCFSSSCLALCHGAVQRAPRQGIL